MTAIAGVVYPEVFQMTDLIRPMLRILTHRGGSFRDIHTYRNIELGLNGRKFAFNEKRTLAAALDGTIFNASEIRKNLESQGIIFLTDDPAELIIHAYEYWDKDIFQNLNGDFAIIILDNKKELLLLARDKIGKKPLYWFQNNQYFLFASELKAILATKIVPQTPAMDALSTYLYLGYMPRDLTPIEGINKLLPAHYLQFNFDGSICINRYWSYSSYIKNSTSQDPKIFLSELDSLIRNAVHIRIPSEGNVGCLVSGGLGSATIASYVKNEYQNKDLTAFTVNFKGQNDEDLKFAHYVAETLGIHHDFDSITSDNFTKNLVKIIWYLDEPLADPNIVATWELARIASLKSKTVFSGMGSDEVFAGHSRYSVSEETDDAFSTFSTNIKSVLRQLLIPIVKVLYKPAAFELVKQERTKPWQFEYMSHNALFSESDMAHASPRLSKIFDPEVFLHKFPSLQKIQSHIPSYLYFDVKTRLPDCFSFQYERLTTAHSLSWVAPFMDQSIVEYLAGQISPENLEESETGLYLKELMKDVFPPKMINRPKRTRRYFLHEWMTGPHVSELFNLLREGTLIDTGLISKDWLEYQLDELKNNKDASRLLWAVLTLEIWFRLYINRTITEEAPNVSVKELLLER